MGLNADEQKLLDELTAKASASDADDWEVEIFSGDKGARLPASKAAPWLLRELGIGDPPAAPAGADGSSQDGNSRDGNSRDGGAGDGGGPARSSYFGKRQATGK